MLAARLAGSLQTDAGDWLELGSGSGRLLEACLASRSIDHFVGVEYDQRLAALSPCSPPVELFQADALQPQALQSFLGDRRFSCVVGNPPFGVEQLSTASIERLYSLYPDARVVNGWARLDLYFMLESLSRLKRPGEAAFIVAAPIVQDPALASFRETLIDSASEVECYELPHKTFDKRAEVQSFLLIARFGAKGGARVVSGRLAGPEFQITQTRQLTREAAIHRLDLAHYEFLDFNQALTRRNDFTTLAQLGASICRGSRSRHEFEAMELEHFHTTDFPRGGGDVSFGRGVRREFQMATAGHILVSRVGSRCIDRTAIVVKGQRAFTEAVYRIIVPESARTTTFDWMSSEDGKAWRCQAALGSCAKHLTVSSLMAMPVPA
ncbi:hypothetical protein G7048_27290 (plasmid) [Diaphorobacter sp. HDW4B]|uniref:Eco57I restriction-modification methylase domain-containing protein n=1 Tax=Diaphorobacter sp. HDW4B TaxID=2714925 RepID=UPI00140BCE82|nr:N-6 DNA methylase [Diaphorobacter sp. HDW4B]QIL74183.1 hypothetical protein G7048_27290 [Diaphorobacter sp. HDW4B]